MSTPGHLWLVEDTAGGCMKGTTACSCGTPASPRKPSMRWRRSPTAHSAQRILTRAHAYVQNVQARLGLQARSNVHLAITQQDAIDIFKYLTRPHVTHLGGHVRLIRCSCVASPA